MKYKLLIIGFVCSNLLAQVDDIPYDWSGQYGVLSNNGRLMWNQDWSFGSLIIDGTFSNYPTRFGTSYKHNFELLQIGNINSTRITYPDSAQIKSKIDYSRGDFSNDQLELNAEFGDKNRLVSFSGFQRSYIGPYSQYTNQNGEKNPLQQSYRLDYSSQTDTEFLKISIGHFITDSRLILNDPADFIHKEKIIAAGLQYSKNIADWHYNVHGAVLQQYYKMDLDDVKAYLNRIHLNHSISKKLDKSSLIEFGVVIDNQSLSLVDTIKKNRTWSSIYGGWQNKYFDVQGGATAAKNELVPFFNISAKSTEKKRIQFNSQIKYCAKPKHLFYGESDEALFEKWLSAQAGLDFNVKKMVFKIDLNYSQIVNLDTNQKYDIDDKSINFNDYSYSSTISASVPFFRDWSIDALYRHAFELNMYSDGIGDRINLGINISEKLFKNNLLAQMKLWGDAYINHHSNLGYEGFHYGPYITNNIDLALPDYWVFNLEVAAKISKMTIKWRVNNILKTAESLTKKIFPNIVDEYLLISNSNNFPPINRFVTINIIWNFNN